MKFAAFVEILLSIEEFWMVANTGMAQSRIYSYPAFLTLFHHLLTFVHSFIFTIKVSRVNIVQLELCRLQSYFSFCVNMLAKPA